MSEIIFLAILALIVIGPKELPQVARTLGRFLNELKRTTSEFTDDLKQQARIDPIDLYDRHNQAPKVPPANAEVKPETEDPGDWSSEDHVPHGQAMAAKESNPQQMEFKIQNTSNDDDDNKGNKG